MNKKGKRLVKSAQAGAEDGANQGVYLIAFGAAAATVYAIWEWIKRRGQ